MKSAIKTNFAGVRFGKLLVVDVASRGKCGSISWNCICDCGTHKVIKSHLLGTGNHKSCGCGSKEALNLSSRRRGQLDPDEDLTGLRFGRLVVIGLNAVSTKAQKRRWDCLCDCGNLKTVQSALLKNVKAQSCGCLKVELLRASHKLKGDLNGTPTCSCPTRIGHERMCSRHYHVWYKFRLTPVELDRKIADQGGLCSLCGDPLNDRETQDGRTAAHIDHCHRTGLVRGVVHAKCNMLIGHYECNNDLLLLVPAYLAKTGS